MKIAVTGAYGQLGGELCRLLGDDAAGLDIDTLDLTDGPAVIAALSDLAPDAVVHCAAYTRVDRAESEPEACEAVNVTAVEHLVEACGRLDCPLVQISTDYVFGGPAYRTAPFCEDDPPSPQGVYARSKLAGERAAGRHSKHLIVRTCGLYARPSDQRAGNFVKTMLRLGRSQQEPRVVCDQQCTPSYVPHVAEAVLSLLGTPAGRPAPWGIYHVTNAGATNWYEFAKEILRLAGMDVTVQPITTAEYAAAAPRPAYSVLDTTKYEALGGPVMPTWESALSSYIEEWKTVGEE
ncbi:MAG TPA: dTDP-4-dehydrorhamnose reductase [Thermoguttaceae bacterium]|nr:dTDP-4-dehydrorhamnose reductase [Thermoguttaceae bacterium]